MKEEIYYGIKNAIERGSSLEEAAQSFLNSGYNSDDVRDAVSMISQGATNITGSFQNPESPPEKSFPVDAKMASPKPSMAGPSSSQSQRMQKPVNSGKSNKLLIIFLVIILLILIGGIISFLLFKDQIIEALANTL